jgi:dipeptidyl aminopeptidase/acylaminoacyl peptidase
VTSSTALDILHDGTAIPATFVSPDGRGLPAVLLLHGTASSRDEVGGLFAALADGLAERGIASLRIDFAGCGDSARSQTDLTVTGELADARAAFTWLAAREEVDAARVAVLGFSQGGTIAGLLAGAEPRLAALVSWSSGVVPWAELDSPFAAAFAGGEDAAEVDLGFRTFVFSRTWWDEVRQADVAAAVAAFAGPVLAIAGTADAAVPPSASAELLAAVASTDTMLVEVRGADHVLGALDPDDPASGRVLRLTAGWLESRLGSRR